MDYEGINSFTLRGTQGINIILGKNGCGKSYMLKQLEQGLRNRPQSGRVTYVSPERAGFLQYEAGVDQNIASNLQWMFDTRRRNQSSNFKQQSASLYRRLELMILRGIERDHIKEGYTPRNFDSVVEKINTLLDRVSVRRIETGGFSIIEKGTDRPASPEEISSGEAELISLAIEFLAFAEEADITRENFLLVDEPDVHLHPDLQDRLARFIRSELVAPHIRVILATHSTPFLSALAEEPTATVTFMRRGDKEISFRNVTDVLRQVLPMFGAHPLSNIYSEAPILLVEGEDDERIWQQAVRSSEGGIKVYPCVAGSVVNLAEYERESNRILGSVYDTARGYSLRDRDDGPEEIEDDGNVIRMRLSCRSAENLMLSDDVLAMSNIDWNVMKERIASFVAESPSHPRYAEMKIFMEAGFPRKSADIKEIRNVLAGMFTSKPWEVAVGQAIAEITRGRNLDGEDSLSSYLGSKVCASIPGLAQRA